MNQVEALRNFGPAPWKLNVGCGFHRMPDYINVDVEPKAKPDIVFDLEQPWPIPSNAVNRILARHVVEHIHDLKTFFQEAYRVLQPNSEIVVHVPHHCSEFFWGDPTHVRPITRMTLDLLSRENCAVYREKGYSNTPLAIYWDVDFEIARVEYMLNDRWKDKFTDADDAAESIDTYNNVISEVRFSLKRVKESDDQFQSTG